LNRERVSVIGTRPTRLLDETSNTLKFVWLRGGRRPLKWFDSRWSEMRLSRRVNFTGSEPVSLLWLSERATRRWRMRTETGNHYKKKLLIATHE
jgi:hypothetical protein